MDFTKFEEGLKTQSELWGVKLSAQLPAEIIEKAVRHYGSIEAFESKLAEYNTELDPYHRKRWEKMYNRKTKS